jgi:dTDP-4-amino-4,6-dideoxygalactose transaminase
MQFIDLTAQQRRIRGKIDDRVRAVLNHGHYIMGPEVAELERALMDFTGVGHCISCASGTDALLMALLAWGIGPGDAVFVPSFSFFATAEVVALLGATPVIVDIDPASFNMNPAALEKAVIAVQTRDASIYPLPLDARTHTLVPRVIIPVDLFGQPAEYERIVSLAAKYGLLLLEDAAQAFGALYKEHRSCNLGCHAAATSFFPAKPLGCYGDGGAIFTNDDALAASLRSIRVHGKKGDDKYDNARIGLNGRLDTLQAAVLLPKLEIFPEELRARQEVAAWYAAGLAAIADLRAPRIAENCVSAWAQYTVLVNDEKRNILAIALKEKGIPVNIYYPTPMHMLAVFRPLGYAPDDMPVALAASKAVLALPFHPYMTQDDVNLITSAVREALS